MDAYDRLYIVSDLHLGGAVEAAIFDSSKELAALIRWAAAGSTDERVGLVLCGDVVDFLAFPGAVYFNPGPAAQWLKQLAAPGHPVEEVFQALRDFTKAPGRRLVVVLGNHDIELALPEVRDTFWRLVASEDGAARSRVAFVFDGTGYRCEVGGRSVLCVHGNERDDWNVIDLDALRKYTRELNAGRPPPEWQPNAGTRLVIDLMNRVKSRLPFVDLLKPETSAVPNVLAALSKERRGVGVSEALLDGARIAARKQYDRRRIELGILSSEGGETSGAVDIGEFSASFGGEAEARAAETPRSMSAEADELRDRVETAWRAKTRPIDLAGREGDVLGGLNSVAAFFGIDTVRNLREALLDAIGAEETFNARAHDETFHALDAWAGPCIDIAIAGHTHLERHCARVRAEGVYFNSGTWIRLIKLKPKFLEERNFEVFLDKLTVDEMQKLDAAEVEGERLVMRRRTVVYVEWNRERAEVHAGLRHVRDNADSGWPFEEQKETRPRDATTFRARGS